MVSNAEFQNQFKQSQVPQKMTADTLSTYEMFYRVFDQDQLGKEVFGIMKKMWYDCSLKAETPESTAYNVGQRDVIAAIQESINYIKEGKVNAGRTNSKQ